jgi:hypothetical protein
MAKQTLHTEPGFTIYRTESITDEMITFLDGIAWGMEGAVYDHLNTREQILAIPHPVVLYLEDEVGIAATAVFCRNDIDNAGFICDSYYVRYFAAHPRIRGRKLIKRFAHQIMTLVRESEKNPCIFFAGVEKGNHRSFKTVTNAGYHQIDNLKTVGFSRFFPKKNPAIRAVTEPEEQSNIRELLKRSYRDYSLVQFTGLHRDNRYYVLERDGEILAGAQALPGLWAVRSMSGFLGWIVINVVPWLPLVRKVFHPKHFRFLAFEAMYCKDGNVDYLYELFEGVLAEFGRYSALFWLSEKSELYEAMVRKKGGLGLLYNFTKDSDVRLMASYANLSEEEIQQVESHPVYAASFDFV